MPEETKVTKTPDGLTVTVYYAADESESKRTIARPDGSLLENALNFFYDRRTTKMYDPNGVDTGFTFESSYRIFNEGGDTSITAPPIELLSPLGFATEITAQIVEQYLISWLPGWSFAVSSTDNFSSIGPFMQTPEHQRLIVFIPPGQATFQSNAGLIANSIMRDPSKQKNTARTTMLAELTTAGYM